MPFLLYHASHRSLHRPGKLLVLKGSLLVMMGVGQVVRRRRELENWRRDELSLDFSTILRRLLT